MPQQYTTQMKQARIRALLEERAGLVARGLWDRVAQVDEELGEVAKGAELPAKRAEKRPAGQGATTR